jgi:hypothetical protein
MRVSGAIACFAAAVVQQVAVADGAVAGGVVVEVVDEDGMAQAQAQ